MPQARRRADLVEPRFQRGNALGGRGEAEHLPGETLELGRVAALVPLHPGRHDHRQPGAVGHVEQRGKRMLDGVVRVAEAGAAGKGQPVQRQRRRPGEFAPRVVIGRIGQQGFGCLDDGVDHRLDQPRLQAGMHRRGEIGLDGVRDDIGRGIHQVFPRHALHQPGIDDGQLGEDGRRGDEELFLRFVVGHHGGAVHFTAGRRQGQDGEHGQCRLDAGLAGEQFPYIAGMGDTGGNRLHAVEHGTAADAENGIDLLGAGQGNALPHRGQQRVADNAAQFDKRDALLGQALRHHGKQAVALDPLAAVAEQHLPDAVPGQVLADQLLLVGTELDAGRIEESKVFHGSAP